MANLRADNLCGPDGRNAIKGSVYFSGYVEGASSDYLYLQDSDDLDMGTGDFTFECWLNAVSHVGTNSPNFMGIFSSGAFTAGGFLIQVNNTGPLRLVIPLAAGGNFEESAGPSLFGAWNHIAVVKTSNVIKGFVNGIEVISASHSVGIDFAHGGYGTVGENCKSTYPGDYPLRGHVSNLRLVKGTALYTSSFTPSTEELTAVDGTVLLCCQDTDDPTQEATGKHEIVGVRGCYEGKRYSNIATNGDLETGDTTGWTNSGCSTFEVSTNNPHSGTYSLHCVSDGNGDYVYTTVSVDTNLRYKISAYINCVGPGGTSAKAKMKIGTSAGASTNYESQTANAGAGWQYVEWIGILSASTTYITFNESSANNVNDWYVDDLKVEVWYPEESENILPNPNFLTGATGWSFSSTPSGEYTISSNKLNLADNSRTSNAYATVQLFPTAVVEGRYRIAVDYAVTSGAFDIGLGNNNVYSISGTSSATYELYPDTNNSSLRIIGNQHCVASWTSVTLYRIAEPKRINELPPVGIDEGVTFEGDTKHNTQGYMYFPTGDTSQRGRGVGLLMGNNSSAADGMKYFSLISSGNTTPFGDLTNDDVINGGAGASSTRGVIGGGHPGSGPSGDVNTMEYVTIATTGNALNFGDLTEVKRDIGVVGSDTRGCWCGGADIPAVLNTIDYITFASTGDAVDFGDLYLARRTPAGGGSSGTRGLLAGGFTGAYPNIIDYITIASTGNGTDFGDLTVGRTSFAGTSSPTRAVWGGGWVSPSALNTMDYVTIATTGNATDFGDLIPQIYNPIGACGSHIRGMWIGGYDGGSPGLGYINNIQYITIATTGNAQDWGDLIAAADNERSGDQGATSDCHGGLS